MKALRVHKRAGTKTGSGRVFFVQSIVVCVCSRPCIRTHFFSLLRVKKIISDPGISGVKDELFAIYSAEGIQVI